MNATPSVWVKPRRHLLALLAASLLATAPACYSDSTRLAQLEAAQQQQARELADVKQQLADKEDEVAQLEQCVDDLEGTVYEDADSVAVDEERPAGPVTL